MQQTDVFIERARSFIDNEILYVDVNSLTRLKSTALYEKSCLSEKSMTGDIIRTKLSQLIDKINKKLEEINLKNSLLNINAGKSDQSTPLQTLGIEPSSNGNTSTTSALKLQSLLKKQKVEIYENELL